MSKEDKVFTKLSAATIGLYLFLYVFLDILEELLGLAM